VLEESYHEGAARLGHLEMRLKFVLAAPQLASVEHTSYQRQSDHRHPELRRTDTHPYSNPEAIARVNTREYEPAAPNHVEKKSSSPSPPRHDQEEADAAEDRASQAEARAVLAKQEKVP